MKSLHLEERERHQKVQEANLMHKEMLEQQMHLNLTLTLTLNLNLNLRWTLTLTFVGEAHPQAQQTTKIFTS